jgi:hypothetical protein
VSTIPTRKETYKLLGLLEPLAWERAARENNLTQGREPQRRSGTTTMLAVEAALDVLHGKTIWLIGYTVTDITLLTDGLDDTLAKLGAPFGVKKNKVHTETWANYQGSRFNLLGTRPDSIYIDHYIGPTGEHRPHTGPYGLIRTVKQEPLNPDHWTALDYDDDFVMTLDEAAATQLADDRPERVRLIPLPAPPIVTLQPDYGLGLTLSPGVSYGPPIKAASTKNVPITSNMVTGVENAMFDGVSVGAGDSVLLLSQDDSIENGVWEVTSSGDGGMLMVLPSPSPLDGATHVIIEGVLYADTLWTYTGSDWVQISAASNMTIGSGYNPSDSLMVVTGDLNVSGTITSGGGLSLQNTQNSEWTAANGDMMRRVTLPDGSVMVYRNGLLEDVEGAEDVPVDPDDPSLLINILADPD